MPFVLTSVLLAALVACGGGTSPGDPSALLEPHQLGASSGPMAVVAPPTIRMAAAIRPLDATSFLNWAETTYPSLFEAPQSNKTIDVWTYRYYPKTDIYLGTNTSGDVLGLMGKVGGQYESYPLGKLADFGCSVYPSDCATVNAAPVANAGFAQSVVAGSVVTLDGSASSDANGDPLTYAWTLTSKPSGSTAVLSSTTSAKPTFTADVIGIYVVSLTVSDGKSSSAPITTTVAVSSAYFSNNGNGTVTDTTTGLTWMRCEYGQNWGGAGCTGTSRPLAWIYATRLNGTVTFAGQSDWRLPNIRELSTLMHRLPNVSRAIDGSIFPGTSLLWSSTAWPNMAGDASRYGRYSGEISYLGNSNQIAALLVRGTGSEAALRPEPLESDYLIGSEGVATHIPTGLMWKRCSEGKTWNGATSTCVGNETIFTWNEAMQVRSTYAQYSDWRLPTAEELVTLIGFSTRGLSAIHYTVFPNTSYTWYWSSSVGGASVDAWGVDFGASAGRAYPIRKQDTYPVRLVRSTH